MSTTSHSQFVDFHITVCGVAELSRLAEVGRIQPLMWPNLRVIELGDAALGRKGELVAAVVAHYRHTIDLRPEVGAMIVEAGRSREVRAAQELIL